MYEVIAILNPNVTNEFVETKISDWTEIIKEYNSELHRVDRWGKKNLAYEVKKFNQGYFLLFHIKGEHAVIAELERRFRISEDVIRYQTVKLNDLEYKTSVELLDQMASRTQEGFERDDFEAEDDDRDDAPERKITAKETPEVAPETVEEVKEIEPEQEIPEEAKEEKPAME